MCENCIHCVDKEIWTCEFEEPCINGSLFEPEELTENLMRLKFNYERQVVIMTKTINITVEVYDGKKTEEIERIVSAALDNNGIDCTYDVEEVEE